MNDLTKRNFKIDLPIDDLFYLSEFRESDLEDIIEQLNDPWIHQCTLSIPSPYTENDGRIFLEKSILKDPSTLQDVKYLHFAIRNSDNRLIGSIGFDGILPGHRAELGYLIGQEYRGQGIIKRGIRIACQFAFKTWDLNKITAQVFDFNQASAKVLDHNGFLNEGRLRQHVQKNDKFVDSIQFGLLRCDFDS